MIRRLGIPVILVATFVLFGMLSAHPSAANCSDAYFACMDPTLLKKVQITLKQKGFSPGTINGRYASSTQRALASFAKSKRIKFENFLTPELSEALFGIRINYEEASEEERLEFLQKNRFALEMRPKP
jgi:hypothetical protein